MKRTTFVLLPICLAAALSHAATLIDNTFNSVTAGDYNGQLGDPYGVAAELGNATGSRSVIPVASSGGVGDSQYSGPESPAIRSRSTMDITAVGKVSFSAYFKYTTTTPTQTGMILLLGWALPAATDNISPYNQPDDRILIGVRRNTSGNLQFAAGGVMGGGTGVGAPPMTPATSVVPVLGDWYQVSFDLTFNYDSGTPANSTVTVDNYKLFGWGSDGVTGGTLLMSSTAASTFNPTYGTNLNTAHTAHIYVIGDGGRGIIGLDNVLVASGSTPPPLVVPVGMAVALSGADVQVSFKSETGLNYQLWKSPANLASWAIVPGVSTAGDGTVKTLTDPAGAPAADGKVFYRVEVTN